MERRITGIIRWLERCMKACKAGAWESALMDAECARADIEHLRDEVWNRLERQHTAKKKFFLRWVPVRAAFWAAVVVLAAASPLALRQEGTMSEALAQQEPSIVLEWVTPDEKMLLSNLRKRLSDGNSLASVRMEENEVSGRETQNRSVSALKSITPPAVRMAEKTRSVSENDTVLHIERKEGASVPYDRIISLVQAGERALKNETPAIRIESN